MEIVKLSKLEGGENIRTKTVVGGCKPPEVGKRFELLNDEPVKEKIQTIFGEREANMRYITTSPVEEIEETDDGWIIETWSGSVYQLDKVEE